MIIFPAIDLKDGEAVRLEEGDLDRAQVFNADPVAQAPSSKPGAVHAVPWSDPSSRYLQLEPAATKTEGGLGGPARES